ncbi:MAG TPA: hypothetical protein VNO35_06510 [Steroidobacteraceae bacterium]|nr:hypothetical protein [Steroidobacteraceae bacterium]
MTNKLVLMGLWDLQRVKHQDVAGKSHAFCPARVGGGNEVDV